MTSTSCHSNSGRVTPISLPYAPVSSLVNQISTTPSGWREMKRRKIKIVYLWTKCITDLGSKSVSTLITLILVCSPDKNPTNFHGRNTLRRMYNKTKPYDEKHARIEMTIAVIKKVLYAKSNVIHFWRVPWQAVQQMEASMKVNGDIFVFTWLNRNVGHFKHCLTELHY